MYYNLTIWYRFFLSIVENREEIFEKVLHFVGVLPFGRHVVDPRFTSWDNRLGACFPFGCGSGLATVTASRCICFSPCLNLLANIDPTPRAAQPAHSGAPNRLREPVVV